MFCQENEEMLNEWGAYYLWLSVYIMSCDFVFLYKYELAQNSS